ncbi:MAG TPA: hypothetical protein VF610_11915 [Segetibacter sp.]|jgi:hypothetical protein
MRLILVLLLFLSNSIGVFSQIDPVANFNRRLFENWKGEYLRIGPFKVKGSPYLLGTSFPGSIAYKEGNKWSDTKILYDIYNQKAGVEINNLMVEGEGTVESFSLLFPENLGGQQLIFKNSANYGKPEMNCFFNVLEEGDKVSFLKLYKTKLARDPVNSMDGNAKVFEQFFEYYVYIKNIRALNKVKLGKKDILKAVTDQQFIKNYMATKQVDLSQESDIIDLYRSYNKTL